MTGTENADQPRIEYIDFTDLARNVRHQGPMSPGGATGARIRWFTLKEVEEEVNDQKEE